MGIAKKSTGDWFHTGRGNVSGNIAKSDKEVMDNESEIYLDEEIFPVQEGAEANKSGGKPIWATGPDAPFHKGRGLGRGHGPDTSKD